MPFYIKINANSVSAFAFLKFYAVNWLLYALTSIRMREWGLIFDLLYSSLKVDYNYLYHVEIILDTIQFIRLLFIFILFNNTAKLGNM